MAEKLVFFIEFVRMFRPASTAMHRTSGLVRPSFRSFAVLASSPNPVIYSRNGFQPVVAPAVVKTLSKAESGVNVATYDHFGPASTLAIVVNAGSRFDTADAPGTAHMLKACLLRVRMH